MKRWLKWTLILMAVVVVLVLVVSGRAVKVTREEGLHLVTNPNREPPWETPADYDLEFEDVTVTTADGLKLVGWYLPSQNGAAVITLHGFKSNRGELLEEAVYMHQHRYGVLVATTRCHDGSEGELITWGRDEMLDLDAWYHYLLTREEVQADRIGMFGVSFGGAMAIKYAAENPAVKAVIAQDTFASLREAVEPCVVGSEPVTLQVRLFHLLTPVLVYWAEREADIHISEVAPVNWIGEISPRPVFLMQDDQNDCGGWRTGSMLYEAAGEPREFWFGPLETDPGFDEDISIDIDVRGGRLVDFFDRYLLAE